MSAFVPQSGTTARLSRKTSSDKSRDEVLRDLVQDMFRERLTSIDDQIAREWASVSLESRKLPDTYSFAVASGKLINPFTGRPVEESINVSTSLDRLEMIAFEKIQDWANETNQGVVFWLSPPHPQRSQQGKIIISEIKHSEAGKQLLNRSILFDTDKDAFLRVSNQIDGEFSDNLKYIYSLDEVRQRPVFCGRGMNLDQWLPKIEKIISESTQWDMIRTGEDVREVERAIIWAKQGRFVSGYIGSNSLSCPLVSPTLAFLRNSFEGKFVRECGSCRIQIQTVIFKGDQCRVCNGTYEGC